MSHPKAVLMQFDCTCPCRGVKMNCPIHGITLEDHGDEDRGVHFTAHNTLPTLRPYTSAERKAMPVQKLLAEYFPDAIAAVARHSLKANDKHNPGEPMHWARGKSTDHLDCAVRHLMTPDAIDADTQEIELVGATWRCLAALQLREEARLKAAGIAPLSGKVPL